MNSDPQKPSYILISSVRNESANIRLTLESVRCQTFPPSRWVIVNDRSTDNTAEILCEYANLTDNITVITIDQREKAKGFASKANSLKVAYDLVKMLEWDFIGVLDGDVSFNYYYYGDILNRFSLNKKLGIAGGFIYEPGPDGVFRSRSNNRLRSVAGAIQLFRRKCFEDVGGIQPIELGGEDTYAEILARMNGWEVCAFPEYPVHHHKPGIAKRGVFKDRIRMGRLDYALGYHPFYEALKFLARLTEKPPVIGSAFRLAGYLEGVITRSPRIAPENVIRHIRNEQLDTIQRFLKTGRLG